MQSRIANLSRVKLEINSRRKRGKPGKCTNMWNLNMMLLNKQWVQEEISWEIRQYLEKMKMKAQYAQYQAMQQKQS